MREADGTIYFKEWLPDQPDLNNPGLTDVNNVIPAEGYFEPYRPLEATGNAIGGTPTGGIVTVSESGLTYIYGSSDNTGNSQIYEFQTPNWTAKAIAFGPSNNGFVDFVQYGNLVIAATKSEQPVALTVGATSSFSVIATSGTVPSANVVGAVGQFVVIGDTIWAATTGPSGHNYVHWSAIDDPRNWPVPNSATAIAAQSGAQELPNGLGNVRAIVGGDQYGLVFQQFGITRMTYIGGAAVFQFDLIESRKGAWAYRGVVNVGALTYFVSDQGFHVTDGVTVKDIGHGKVDKFFIEDLDVQWAQTNIRGAADFQRKIIYWLYPDDNSTNGAPNRIIAYNYAEDRWSKAAQEGRALFSGNGVVGGSDPDYKWGPLGFTTAGALAHFSATAGTATLVTAEIEPNSGGYSRTQGIKPHVAATVNAVTVAIGTRNDQITTPSFTSEVTANSRSGFCDFRSEARYHRARVTITGTFNAAQGLEFQVEPSGPV